MAKLKMQVEEGDIVSAAIIDDAVSVSDSVIIERLKKEIAALKLREAELLERISNYENDGMYALFFALNRKANETASSLNSFELSLTTEDKSFERYIALLKVQGDQSEALDKLRKQYLGIGEADIKQAEKEARIPIIERRGKGKETQKPPL